MEQIEESFAPARRGRPPTGRKIVAQVPMEPQDIERVRHYAELQDRAVADVLRDLIKGDIKWHDIVRHSVAHKMIDQAT